MVFRDLDTMPLFRTDQLVRARRKSVYDTYCSTLKAPAACNFQRICQFPCHRVSAVHVFAHIISIVYEAHLYQNSRKSVVGPVDYGKISGFLPTIGKTHTTNQLRMNDVLQLRRPGMCFRAVDEAFTARSATGIEMYGNQRCATTLLCIPLPIPVFNATAHIGIHIQAVERSGIAGSLVD